MKRENLPKAIQIDNKMKELDEVYSPLIISGNTIEVMITVTEPKYMRVITLYDNMLGCQNDECVLEIVNKFITDLAYRYADKIRALDAEMKEL